MKKAVIFDLDGTLLDSLKDLYLSVNGALWECGLPYRTQEEVKSFVGDGVKNLILRCIDDRQDKFDECMAAFKRLYDANMQNQTRPYTGVRDMLKNLKKSGYLTAVISNKYHEAATSLVSHYFGKDIDVTVGQREGIAIKPDPEALLSLIGQLGIDKSEAVLVGDGEADVKCALNAGVDFIAASWGFRHYSVLRDAGAKVFATTPADVVSLVQKF